MSDGTEAKHAAIQSVRAGILWALSAVFLFSTMGALVKLMSQHYAITQIAFARSFFALAVILPLFLAQGAKLGQSGWWLGHVLRGVIGVTGMLTVYYSYAKLPLADAVAITFTVPLWVAAFAGPLLGERVDARAWAAIAVGFAGVLVIFPPTGEADWLPAAMGVVGNGLIALQITLIRRLGRTDSTTRIVLYYTLALALGTGVLAPIGWRTPSWEHAGILVGVGALAGAAHLCLTQAYRVAPAAVVASFDYTGLLWSVLYGFVLWQERPSARLALGAAIIIASGIYVLRRNSRRAG